jgi:ABC-type sulfate/molybdate transport systems ATPase subunit
MAVFGKMLIDPESLRMLIFGLALVLVMRFKPAGCGPRPSASANCRAMPDGAISCSKPRRRQAFRRRQGAARCLADHPPGRDLRLIGPNGAGKTTFFNCMTGLYVPDGGGFTFAGAPLLADAPHKAAERGIARTFQNIRLFANMTALENVMVGRHVRTRAGVLGAMLMNAATRAEEAAIRQRAIELLHYVRH